MKKPKCLYQKLVTCGISDSQTPCQYCDLRLRDLANNIAGLSLEEMRTGKDYKTVDKAKEAIKKLQSWESEFKQTCSLTHVLSCGKQNCVYNCKGDFFYDAMDKIMRDSDWTKDSFDCESLGSEFTMYPANNTTMSPIGTPMEEPPLEDMKKLKCLYKKLVTCGIDDTNTQC